MPHRIPVVILDVTYINWKRMLARSSALEASERSIAVSMEGRWMSPDFGGPEYGWISTSYGGRLKPVRKRIAHEIDAF